MTTPPFATSVAPLTSSEAAYLASMFPEAADVAVCVNCAMPIGLFTDTEGDPPEPSRWWLTEQGWNLCPGQRDSYHNPGPGHPVAA